MNTLVTSLPPTEISAGKNVTAELSKLPFGSAKTNCNSVTIPIPSGPPRNIPKKPMRPLTAYHIFFQAEREYIIQTLPGATEVPIASNKTFLPDVPQRYAAIKLSPDWYFGPGKRPKRKHRKAHGKVGFMELSRIIASRWAELDTLDPEVKAFVQRLAKQELDEYLADMKVYKEATKDLKPVAADSTVSSAAVAAAAAAASAEKKTKKRPLRPVKKGPVAAAAPTQMPVPMHVPSFHSATIDLSNEIDYFISRINNDARQLLPPSAAEAKAPIQNNVTSFPTQPRQQRRNSLLMYLEPLFENVQVPLFDTSELEQDAVIQQEEQHAEQPSKKQRRNSPSSVAVDIGDDEIIRMWKDNNNRA